ncbi:hypothetical protein ACH5RR_006946 [Cinchona calisaya]|uniref:DUF4283 domain-containing protein n=1 Tax=Cinchona calisaya TaxID=153742 RepID=A0ABD3AQI0_9GENT
MANELEALCCRLKITKSEDREYVVTKSVDRRVHRYVSLVGCVVRRCFAKIDIQRVLGKASWSFDKNMLILKEFDGDVQPSRMVFDKCPFWIRIYNLPPNLMDKDTGLLMGDKMGKAIAADVGEDGIDWGIPQNLSGR